MTVLILNRGPIENRPYNEWLADYDGDVLLLSSQEELDERGHTLPDSGYRHIEAVTDYANKGVVEARALELARQHDVRYVIASQEHDLERAAALRAELGLPGQSLDSALAFRDKLLMKKVLGDAGIPVAAHADIVDRQTVRDFAATHGLPLVIKPRDGSSSVGLKILRTPEQLEAFLGEEFDDVDPLWTGRLVEAYVEGSMYHVDGMIRNGKLAVAWPSHYLYQLAAFADDDKPRIDIALAPDDPMAARLLELTERVFAAMPTPLETTFHCEVFHTPDDQLVVCEVASRNGGALIKSVLHAMFGIDFPIAWIRASVGLPIGVPNDGTRMVPQQLAGQLLLLKRHGRVVSAPTEAPFEWVHNYQCLVTPGMVMTGAASSGDFMTMMVVSGPDRPTVEARIAEAAAWFDRELVVEPVADDARRPRHAAPDEDQAEEVR